MAPQQPRVLILSQRAAAPRVGFAHLYEFENLIGGWGETDILAPPSPTIPLRRTVNSMLHTVTRVPRIANVLTPPKPAAWRPKKEYDLFLAVLPTVATIFALRDLARIKENCLKTAAYVPEVWGHRMRADRHLLDILKQFDTLYVSTRQGVGGLAELTGRPVHYLPYGIDALRFAPGPNGPVRSIDVLNLDRTAGKTHAALLSTAEEKGLFYYADLGQAATTDNVDGARHMLSELMKRSRYVIADGARPEGPEASGGDLSPRLFEAAAAGAVILGDVAKTSDRSDVFDWDDAIVDLGLDAEDVTGAFQAIESDPAREALIRRTGPVQALRRHDWAYRWQTIMGHAGLEVPAEVSERIDALEAAANTYEGPRLEAAPQPAEWAPRETPDMGAPYGDGNDAEQTDRIETRYVPPGFSNDGP